MMILLKKIMETDIKGVSYLIQKLLKSMHSFFYNTHTALGIFCIRINSLLILFFMNFFKSSCYRTLKNVIMLFQLSSFCITFRHCFKQETSFIILYIFIQP